MEETEEGTAMRRWGLPLTIALAVLACPSRACANGFEHFTEQLIFFYLVLPLGMCCAD